MCEYSDTDLIAVAAAVQILIAIPSPNSKLGRVGGGQIEHPFFYDWKASIEYESVEDLQDHVNGVSVLFRLPLSLSHLSRSRDDNSSYRSSQSLGGMS